MPEVDIYPIEKLNFSIEGKILYITSSENNNIFVLTDSHFFYVIEKGEEKRKKQYTLIPTIVRESGRYQTEENLSQIWCDKLGNHVIIKFQKSVYYYNPSIIGEDKVREINFAYEGCYLEICSIAFNEEFQERNDTGEIIFSDYNSDIYSFRIRVGKDNNVYEDKEKIFSFRPPKSKNSDNNKDNKENDDDPDSLPYFSFFELSKTDRIQDMKLIISCKNSNMYENLAQTQGKNIFILAVTRNILFQFSGQDSFKKVFENYSLENGDILKGYKKFPGKTRNETFKQTRLQLIGEYLLSSLNSKENEKPGYLFGWMTESGYCMGKLRNLDEPTPQKVFSVFKYIKPKKDGTKEGDPCPKMVCQSINHIFYLYKDCLVIENKLTNHIIHVNYFEQFFDEVFVDMYYNSVFNGILLYTSKGIYKITLEQEHRFLWKDYIEIGDYELALQTLTTEDKYMKPKLHKLFADHLFNQKEYLKAAKEYAFSDETFEQVCLKFLNSGNFQSLILYFEVVNMLRIKNKDKERNFLQKYLLNTWLFELKIGKDENSKKGELVPFIRDFTRDGKHARNGDTLDLTLLYFILHIYGRDEELLEFAGVKEDYETIILSLINHKDFGDALLRFETYMSYGVNEEYYEKLSKTFFNYASLFMKESPKRTINLIDKHFNNFKNPDDVIRIIISTDLRKIPLDENNFQVILNYIKKLMQIPIQVGEEKVDFTKNQNLHNLYILLLSLSKKEEHKEEIIEYLKGPLHKYEEGSDIMEFAGRSHAIYIDLYFAKKVLKGNYKALSLVCCLMGQYNESIQTALEHNLKDIAIFIAQNLEDMKLKKEIWLKIFKYYKKDSFQESKDIVNESNGIIKIEDILPYMGDNVKINEFNDELKKM